MKWAALSIVMTCSIAATAAASSIEDDTPSPSTFALPAVPVRAAHEEDTLSRFRHTPDTRTIQTSSQPIMLIARQEGAGEPSTPDDSRGEPAKNESGPLDTLTDDIRLPRPNLGPEPLPATPSSAPRLILVSLAIAWVFVSALRIWRPRGQTTTIPAASVIRTPNELRSPMATWAEAVRERLVARYGPSWAAKTTEELASRPELAEQFTPEQASQIIAFLQAADRVKFAHDGEEPAQRETWEGWVSEFLASADAEPTSRSSGK
jgi:hypothetical protein